MPDTRGHATYNRMSTCCTRSSAWWGSRQSTQAVRYIRGRRAPTYSVKPVRSPIDTSPTPTFAVKWNDGKGGEVGSGGGRTLSEVRLALLSGRALRAAPEPLTREPTRTAVTEPVV